MLLKVFLLESLARFHQRNVLHLWLGLNCWALRHISDISTKIRFFFPSLLTVYIHIRPDPCPIPAFTSFPPPKCPQVKTTLFFSPRYITVVVERTSKSGVSTEIIVVFTCYAFYLKAFNLFSTGLTVRHVIMTITSERTGKSDLFDLTFRSDQLSDAYVTTSR